MPLSDLWELDQTPSEGEAVQSLRRKTSRHFQTIKARIALAVAREKKKRQEAEEDDVNMDLEATRVFQRQFLASSSQQWDPFEETDRNCDAFHDAHGRKRAVYLYFKSFAAAVKKLFQCKPAEADSSFQDTQQCQQPIRHLVSLNSNDDTNVKLGSGTRGSSEVRTVMNNIQEHVVIARSAEPKWFALHQPIVALDRADTKGLYHAFMAWVLGFAGYVGWRLRAWGIPSDIFKTVHRHTFIFIGDALRVNNALFKNLIQCVLGQGQSPTQSFALQIHCCIHQIALTRKTVVLGFPGYWSCWVRMGHLFESHTFRQKFAATMSMIIQNNFEYIEVAELPVEAVSWNQSKLDALRLHMDIGHMGLGKRRCHKASTRLKLLLKILQKDNGDASSETFTHWCTGQNCCPSGKDEAVTTMITSYLQLFSHAPVPLLYRWKHAAASSNYVRDGFFFHRILPRTLQAMPTVKCALSKIIRVGTVKVMMSDICCKKMID